MSMMPAIHGDPNMATTQIPMIQQIIITSPAEPPGPDEFESDSAVKALLRVAGGARAKSSDRQLLGAAALWKLHDPDGNRTSPYYGNASHLIIFTYRRLPDLYNTIGNGPSNSFLD